MNSVSNIINPFLIKESFNKYSDSNSFLNYQKIAKDYYKLYTKYEKKLNSIQPENLRTKIKTWFFNLSLESRIKICTVENELFSTIIYQMYLKTKNDKSIEFFPKSDLYEIYDYNSNQNIYKEFIEDLPEFDFSLEKYFDCKSDIYSSYVEKYNMMENNLYEADDNDKKYNNNIFEFINNNIKFYSVHHKPYPDCFCLSPLFLLNEERFDSTFNFFGNINYFKKIIRPFFNLEKNIYGYFLPEWFSEYTNLSITKYIFAFIEQVILVKYVLNNYFINKKPIKNDSIISLINDENLNRIFIDRKTVINYFNMNYNDTNSKKKLLNETNLEKIFDKILLDNEINNKLIYYRNFRRNYNYNSSKGAMLIQPLLDISSNNCIYNPFYDDIRMLLNTNQEEKNNYVINKIRKDINKIIEFSDNITFTDYLLYQNAVNLWEYEYFVYFEIIDHFINLFNEQNYKDLLEEEKETTTKKKKKRKKKKNKGGNDDEIKNNNNINNNDINNNKKNIEENNDNKNNFINIDLECYKELFKDDEKILYAPYYLSVNYDLKKKFKNIKDNKLKSIAKKNKKQDIKEIYNYIKNELLLKYIINKVIYLQPDNYVNFFDNNNEIKINKPVENNSIKIKGLKLIKKNIKKSDDDLDFITINFNLNDKKADDSNNNKINLNEEKNKEELLIKPKKERKENNEININKMININKEKDIIKDKDKIIRENNNVNNNIKIQENPIQLNPLKLLSKSNSNQRSNSNHSRNKSTHKKKQKNNFFLFDTVKTKQKNKNKSKSPNKPKHPNNIPSTLNIKILKINNIDNNNLSFFEKLHNNILKNEKNVNIILQHLTKYKNYCINEIKKLINKTYENKVINYSIDLYGSYTTGLMIEASDIDIKIKLYNLKKDEFNIYFNNLDQTLNLENKFEKIIPISTASVPVIKLIIDIEKFIKNNGDLGQDFFKLKNQNFFKNYFFDKNELTQIRVDITFIIDNNTNNKEIMNKIENDNIDINNNEKSNVIYIKEQLELFPEIKPILILLKRYFYVKNMNSSFEGGLSSYNLFLLLLSFAKYNSINFSQNKNKIINLGYFLLQFLEFFGKNFDFKNLTVNLNSPYIYEINSFSNYNSGKSLTILDPLTGLNASKSSYKIFEIQNMFLNAYNFFEKERINYEYENNKNENNDKRNNDKQYEGILGLSKINKKDCYKKNNKNKNDVNIIYKFFSS